MTSLCVFCGSRNAADSPLQALAAEVGRGLAARGIHLVYGGGRTGMMGGLADAAMAAGGTVTGIIPKSLDKKEVIHRGCTELLIVPDMAVRKAEMMTRSDAFLVLPGGIGTMDELFEVWTALQLGHIDKPIGILNHEGFYDPLFAWLDHAFEQQLIATALRSDLVVETELEPLLDRLG